MFKFKTYCSGVRCFLLFSLHEFLTKDDFNNMVYKRNAEYPKTFAEFFAGIGLMRMGLEKAGWQIKFANDIDPMKEQPFAV